MVPRFVCQIGLATMRSQWYRIWSRVGDGKRAQSAIECTVRSIRGRRTPVNCAVATEGNSRAAASLGSPSLTVTGS